MKDLAGTSLFTFWRGLDSNTFIHPDDEPVFSAEAGRHSLSTECIPVPFYGPLAVAPIVLLYLNPGLSAADVEAANNAREREFYWCQRQGTALLRDQTNLPKKSWWVSRTKAFSNDIELLRRNIAVVQLCAYHSASFTDDRMLDLLPSSDIVREWSRDVLFPLARSRERIVICLRSARKWGLTVGSSDGHLFAPMTTRNGYMIKNEQRRQIIQVVQNVLNG